MNEELQDTTAKSSKTIIIVILIVIVALIVALVFLIRGGNEMDVLKIEEVNGIVPPVSLTPERKKSLQERIEQNPQVSLTEERQKTLQERIKQMEQ